MNRDIRDYNIAGGIAADLSSADDEYCYRAQRYPAGLSESDGQTAGSRSHYFFSKSTENRFAPVQSGVGTYYFGYGNPLAVLLETLPIFRESSLNLPRPLPFGASELERIEIIKFKITQQLKLFDLNSNEAFVRHNMKINDEVLCSTDLSRSSGFADLVLNEGGYDGILYRTRQGMTHAAVVFETSKSIIENNSIVVERMSALSMLRGIPDSEKRLGIRIVDDLSR